MRTPFLTSVPLGFPGRVDRGTVTVITNEAGIFYDGEGMPGDSYSYIPPVMSHRL